MRFDKTNYKDALDSYQKEKNHFVEETVVYIDRIAQKYRKFGKGRGWILTETKTNYRKTNTATLFEEKSEYIYRYEMDTEGHFYIYSREWESTYENGRMSEGGGWSVEDTGDTALRKTLSALDFDLNASSRSESGSWVFNSNCSEVNLLSFDSNPGFVTLERKSDYKGYGLYCALKKIAENSVPPVPIVPQEQEKESKKAREKALARSRRPYTIATAAVILPSVLLGVALVLCALEKLNNDYWLRIVSVYGVYMLPAIIFLNYANAWVREYTDTLGIRLFSFGVSPFISIAFNLIIHAEIIDTDWTMMFDINTVTIVVLIILIVVIHCNILLKRK